MHDNDTTDAENRAATVHDLKVLYVKVVMFVTLATAATLAGLAVVAEPGYDLVLIAGAVFLAWLSMAAKERGYANTAWNITFGRVGAPITETIEEMSDGGEPT